MNAVNDAPVAGNDAYATDEDTTLTVAAPACCQRHRHRRRPADGGAGTGPSQRHPDAQRRRSFTYTPTANFNGTDSFTYRANDGTADSNVGDGDDHVNPVNDAPVAADDATTQRGHHADRGRPGVLANDTDVDGDALSTRSSTRTRATARSRLNADGSFTYTPDANFNGTDSFTYRANDGDRRLQRRHGDHHRQPRSTMPPSPPTTPTASTRTPRSPSPPPACSPTTPTSTATRSPRSWSAARRNGTLTLNADGSFTYTPERQLQRHRQLHLPRQRRHRRLERRHGDDHRQPGQRCPGRRRTTPTASTRTPP